MIDQDLLVDEIKTLHDDLGRWLGMPDAHDGLERFGEQLHREFSMVVMQGAVVAREQLLKGLEGAGHSMPGLTIDIVDIEVLHRADDCAVARFREIHHRPDGPAARWTSGLLLADAAARNGLRWRSVHETLVP
ncbi:DUF4440 domain-containing protein [Nocardia sp. CDC160]|uniref:DUF4440 domain-containing protein n=1 Tax=Nocardia sp. CDC160 TaxID=3112166 RepID=UPI002DB74E23|nr:DUF4440 domain-containing protein [Nocardia sp. CDC160]MEC3914491.1 DUF4440 domain-containing protein [Nocardia sp. CDC160]